MALLNATATIHGIGSRVFSARLVAKALATVASHGGSAFSAIRAANASAVIGGTGFIGGIDPWASDFSSAFGPPGATNAVVLPGGLVARIDGSGTIGSVDPWSVDFDIRFGPSSGTKVLFFASAVVTVQGTAGSIPSIDPWAADFSASFGPAASGTAGLTVNATHTANASTSISATGFAVGNATHTPLAGTVIISGRSSPVATAALSVPAMSTLVGSGTLAVDTSHTPLAAAIMSAAGLLNVDTSHTPVAQAVLSGFATITGNGFVTTLWSASATLSGVATAVISTTAVLQSAVATLAGSAISVGTALVVGQAVASCDAAGVVFADTLAGFVNAVIPVEATLVATSVMRTAAVGLLSTSATVVGILATQVAAATSVCSGAALLSINTIHTPAGTAVFTSTGRVAADPSHTPVITGLVGGSATFGVSAQAAFQSEVGIAGRATLLGDTSHTPTAASISAGVGQVIATPVHTPLIDALMVRGAALVDAALSVTSLGLSRLSGFATILVFGSHPPTSASARIDAVSTLTFGGMDLYVADFATVRLVGSVSVNGIPSQFAEAIIMGSSVCALQARFTFRPRVQRNPVDDYPIPWFLDDEP